MDKFFTKTTGEKVNIALHTLEMLKLNPQCQIHIGCDSQSKKNITEYAVVVAYKHPDHRGAHFVYSRVEIPRIKDIFTRLFKECEYSLEVAEYLTKETGCRIACIELDYADEKITQSTPLVKATTGWVTGAGYKATCKSGEQIATRAADKIVEAKRRFKKKKRRK